MEQFLSFLCKHLWPIGKMPKSKMSGTDVAQIGSKADGNVFQKLSLSKESHTMKKIIAALVIAAFSASFAAEGAAADTTKKTEKKAKKSAKKAKKAAKKDTAAK